MMMKKDDNTPLALEHANLKSHYTQSSTPTTTRPSHLSILSLSTLSFQSRFSSFNRPGLRDKENDKKEPYKSIRTWGGMEAELEREKELVEKMKGLVGVEEVSTINQRLAQPLKQAHLSANLEPMRTHLRTKLSKRCRSCEHILVKPEQKAQVTRFKIKMIAMSYLPEITILQPTPTLVQNETCKIKLKFTNPLEEDNTVHLFIPLATLQNQVKASCSRFTIPAYNEMAQYEEPAQPRRGGIQKSGTADSKNAGAVEVKGNSVVVELEVIPKGPLGNIVEFPLYITSSAITPSSQSSSLTDLSTGSQVGKLKEGIQVPPSTPMESTGNLFDIDASNKDAKLTDKEALVKSGGELEGSGGKGLTVEVIVSLGTVISKMDTSK
ncbi:dynactin p62 family-domain-containing protein [Paraphysoderma sedebokerense]|nr:dynactin p62 family-domain-containing protein [Paraphysoderma sedebokerense]